MQVAARVRRCTWNLSAVQLRLGTCASGQGQPDMCWLTVPYCGLDRLGWTPTLLGLRCSHLLPRFQVPSRIGGMQRSGLAPRLRHCLLPTALTEPVHPRDRQDPRVPRPRGHAGIRAHGGGSRWGRGAAGQEQQGRAGAGRSRKLPYAYTWQGRMAVRRHGRRCAQLVQSLGAATVRS